MPIFIHFYQPPDFYDAATRTFVNACTAASHSLTVSESGYIDTMVRWLKANGGATSYWDRTYALYPFIGGDVNSHKFNLKNPSYGTITFSGSPTHDANGVTYDGASNYGNTGIKPNDMDLDNVGMTVYCQDSVTGSLGGMWSTNYFSLMPNYNGTIDYCEVNNAFGTGGTGFSTIGMCSMNRTSSTAFHTTLDGVLQNIITRDSSAKSSNNIWFGGSSNGAPALTFPSAYTQCLGWLHEGFTVSESLDIYTNCIQPYQTSLEREV